MSLAPAPSPETCPSNLLLVDDEPLYLDALTQLLQPLYRVRAVTSGERALVAVADEPAPDLILLDVLMPGMGGFELLRHLKANAATSDIPVIFITALDDEDSEQRGFELGAVDYVRKPLRPLTVLARVHAQLNAKAARDLLRSTNLRLKDQVAEGAHALARAQQQLMHLEKLTAMGQLAAGIAHEVNNPIAFVGANLNVLSGYLNDLLTLLQAYQHALALWPEQALLPDPARLVLAQINALRQRMDIDFLQQDARALLLESVEGVDRVRRIVRDLKDFSRSNNNDWQWVDLHTGLDATLNLLRSEIKSPGTVVKRYAALPPVHCLPHQLNQVFMNLLINALHAIDPGGVITIETQRLDQARVRVQISDTGPGIDPAHLPHIFEAFYTTKALGEGTGLGLSLSRGIIERHNGQLTVDSTPGQGSTFSITLPVDAHPPELTDADV